VRKWVLLGLAALCGGVVGFAIGRLADNFDAITAMTSVLVLVTVYYAWQTREMVQAIRADNAAAMARADRLLAQPALEEWLERVDDFTRRGSGDQATASLFASSINNRRALITDADLLSRVDIAGLALRTYANDNTLQDEGSSAMVVSILLRGLRESLVAGLRGQPLPPIPTRWLDRAATQAAVIDAPTTLENWR